MQQERLTEKRYDWLCRKSACKSAGIIWLQTGIKQTFKRFRRNGKICDHAIKDMANKGVDIMSPTQVYFNAEKFMDAA